ncbi:hypothetical protein FOFC_08905, partial [Fusarium oxysporum]
ALDIAFGRYFSRVICGFFLPRHSGFASLRQSGLCAPRLPVRPTSAALAAQTTFAASCRSTLRVVAPSPSPSPSHAALRCLDRPLQLLLPEQHQQPLAARLGPSGAPLSRRTGPKWLAALFAARTLHDRSLQSCTAQRPSSSLQPRLPPGTRPGFDDLSHWLRPLDKTAGSKWYRACLETVERGDCLVHRAAFWPPWVFLLRGFSPRMHGLGCSYWRPERT